MIRKAVPVAVVIVLIVPAIAMALATLTVSPRSVRFDARCVRSSSPDRTITVTNEGDGTAQAVSVSVTPESMAGVFRLKGATVPKIVRAGNDFTLSVGYTPQVPGKASAKAVVRYEAIKPSPSPSPSSSKGPKASSSPKPAPSASPTPRSTSIPFTGEGIDRFASVSPRAVAFGTLRRGRTSSRTVTIFNDGSAPLIIGGTSISGRHAADFRFRSRPTSSLGPGASTDVRLTFAPKAAGARAAELLIRTNACGDGTLRVPLGGQMIEPSIRVEPETLDFGTRPIGTTRKAEITISNDGEDTLLIRSLDLEAEKTGIYRLDGYPKTFPVRIGPHKVRVMTLVFKAVEPGVLKAVLTITSNDPDEKVIAKDVFGAGILARESAAPLVPPSAVAAPGPGFHLNLGPYLGELFVVAAVSLFFGALVMVRRVRGIPE